MHENDNMDWAQPGVKAAILYTSSRLPRAVAVTIERRTATQIITTGSHEGQVRRFRVATGREVGEFYGQQLVPLTNERARAAFRAAILQDIRNRVENALSPDTASPDPLAAIDEAIRILTAARDGFA